MRNQPAQYTRWLTQNHPLMRNQPAQYAPPELTMEYIVFPHCYRLYHVQIVAKKSADRQQSGNLRQNHSNGRDRPGKPERPRTRAGTAQMASVLWAGWEETLHQPSRFAVLWLQEDRGRGSQQRSNATLRIACTISLPVYGFRNTGDGILSSAA
jgi:hypothetical protein